MPKSLPGRSHVDVEDNVKPPHWSTQYSSSVVGLPVGLNVAAVGDALGLALGLNVVAVGDALGLAVGLAVGNPVALA